MEATDNLKRLAQLAIGDWSFYDAVDYTPSRLQRKQTANVVRNYMAHHQRIGAGLDPCLVLPTEVELERERGFRMISCFCLL